MKKKAFEAQQEFIQMFSTRVNDNVTCVEMSELQANSKILKSMGFARDDETQSIWGVIVICEKSLYFYVPPHELRFMSMLTTGGENVKIEEHLFCFNNLHELKFIAIQKKWYEIFSVNKIEFSYLQENKRVYGELVFSKSTKEILKKIRSALNL